MFSPIVGSMRDVSSAGTGTAMKVEALLEATGWIVISDSLGRGALLKEAFKSFVV